MVEYITYKEQRYPIRIGYYTLKMLQSETGKGIEDAANDISVYETILYYALKQGAKVAEVDFKFKKEDMEDVLDEALFEFIALIPKFFPTGVKGDLKKKM